MKFTTLHRGRPLTEPQHHKSQVEVIFRRSIPISLAHVPVVVDFQ